MARTALFECDQRVGAGTAVASADVAACLAHPVMLPQELAERGAVIGAQAEPPEQGGEVLAQLEGGVLPAVLSLIAEAKTALLTQGLDVLGDNVRVGEQIRQAGQRAARLS